MEPEPAEAGMRQVPERTRGPGASTRRLGGTSLQAPGLGTEEKQVPADREHYFAGWKQPSTACESCRPMELARPEMAGIDPPSLVQMTFRLDS